MPEVHTRDMVITVFSTRTQRAMILGYFSHGRICFVSNKGTRTVARIITPEQAIIFSFHARRQTVVLVALPICTRSHKLESRTSNNVPEPPKEVAAQLSRIVACCGLEQIVEIDSS